MDIPETLSKDYIDAQYKVWKADPKAVSRDWQFFFEGFEIAGAVERETTDVCDEDHVLRQSRVDALINRYRDIGHFLACLDPLTACPTDHPLLSLSAFNLGIEDLET
ncbi:MAG: 2-oxoglutarate dehydrogenase E1 component, partial [Desulfobacterales bacterium]|nr:2-oxoglutarate dehydrogenase E1 component [Desulfobacterales bacterium]